MYVCLNCSRRDLSQMHLPGGMQCCEANRGVDYSTLQMEIAEFREGEGAEGGDTVRQCAQKDHTSQDMLG